MNVSWVWKSSRLPQGMALVAGLGLSVEAFLQFTRGTSLCQTSGCRVAAEVLRIQEPVLVALGAGFFLFLAGAFTLARRLGRDWPWWAAAAALFGALAFDGSLLGYQFTGMDERCTLCILVSVSLGLTLLLLGLERRSWIVPALGLIVFSGGFLSNAVLKAAPKVPCLEETAFVHKKPGKGSPLKLHLYFSLHCPHCTQVLANLAVNEPWHAEWYLSACDSKEEDLLRLAEIRERAEQNGNPFRSVLEVKDAEKVEADRVPEEVKQAVERARRFVQCNRYEAVPILFAQEGKGRQVISVGSYNIMAYLRARGIVTKTAVYKGGKVPGQASG